MEAVELPLPEEVVLAVTTRAAKDSLIAELVCKDWDNTFLLE
jgi:hypothetical protein